MLQTIRKHTHTLQVYILLVLTFVLVFGTLLPKAAYAKDYSIDSVNIDATLTADGSVTVQEARQFNFDGAFNGVYINIPKGTYNGQSVEPSVSLVQVKDDNGTTTTLAESASGANNTYTVTDEGSFDQIKVYSKQEDETATFIFTYSLSNLATRFEDEGELYWKFVSDGWEVESQNVTMRLHLPVPQGESATAGQNVYVWGHGPLDASVNLDGNDVVATVPGVGTSEFAEVRVLFPESWLSAATTHTGTVKDSVLAEEQQLADAANAARAQARALRLGAIAVVVTILIVGNAAVLYALRDYKRNHKAQFDDTYFRDVPTDDHPAVLGYLYRGSVVANDLLCASIMALTNDRWLKLTTRHHEGQGFFDRSKDEYVLQILPESQRKTKTSYAAKKIYEKTMALIEAAAKGEDSVSFDEIEAYARKSPKKFSKKYTAWLDEVSTRCVMREFYIDDKPLKIWIPAVALGLYVLSILGLFVGSDIIGMGDVVLFMLMLGTSCAFAGTTMAKSKKYSREALEIRAKMAALEAWLKDFTRIEQSVPNDILLWNRLLVMACALGIADRVIDQLKVAYPNFNDDMDMMPSYMWFYAFGHGGQRPFDTLSSSVAAAHSVSVARMAGSSASSGSGFGGGFSGGGGGGFGGGGGGGAF